MPRLLLAALLLGCIQGPAATQEHFADREKKAPEKIKRELSALRKEAGAQKWTFKIAYTKAMDHRLSRLAGTRFPDDIAGLARQVNALADKALRVDRLAGNVFAKRHPKKLPGRDLEPRVRYESYAKHKSFDWRSYHKVTPVRNQGPCGTCWDFAALAAFESSYAIRN